MNTTIDQGWLPCDKTKAALKRRGFSQKQFNHVRRIFLRENYNMQLKDANTKFTNMFKGMHGEDLPKPDNSVSEENDKKRAKDIKNRSKDASQKAKDSHNIDDKMSKEDAIAFYMKGRG